MLTANRAETMKTGIKNRLQCFISGLAKYSSANMHPNRSRKDTVSITVFGRSSTSGSRMNSSAVVILFMAKIRKMCSIIYPMPVVVCSRSMMRLYKSS